MSKQINIDDPTLSFYYNKNILITGSTGFVGKIVVEKLLRVIGSSLGTIFVLIRPKTGTHKKKTPAGHVVVEDGHLDAADRLRHEIYESRLFDRCRSEIDDFEQLFFSKIVPVDGDLEAEAPVPVVTQPHLLARLQHEVTVVLHLAASVAFDEPIQTAFRQNVRAAVQLFELARTFTHLCSYVHVSTAYVTCDRPDGFVSDELAPVAHLLGDKATSTVADILEAGEKCKKQQQHCLSPSESPPRSPAPPPASGSPSPAVPSPAASVAANAPATASIITPSSTSTTTILPPESACRPLSIVNSGKKR